jgi:uncharacterized protein YqgQ
MDREQQIEIISYEYLFVYVDNIKHIRYIIKAIVDNEPIQSNLQLVYDGNIISKEDFFNKTKDGMIKERYR